MERQIRGAGCGASLSAAQERQKARLKVLWKQEEECASATWRILCKEPGNDEEDVWQEFGGSF